MLSDNTAEISLTADESRLAAGLRRAMGLVRDFAAGVGQKMGSLVFSPRSEKKRDWIAHATGQIGGTLAMRGIDVIVDQGKHVMDFEEKLTRFGIAAKQTPLQLENIRRVARQTSVAIGEDANVVLDSARAYVDLAGSQAASTKNMQTLARAGQASEATGQDLAGMMYQLTKSMKVTDDQMEDTMGGLINQAKDGAIEAKQMAKEFGAMMPLFARFGVLGREGAVQAGAMFQVIRDGYNTADEAGTGIVRIFAGLRTHASRFEKAGVKIWNVDKDGVKHARKFSEIFADIQKSKLVKDPELMKKAFGRTEAWRGMEMLLENIPRMRELEAAGMANGVIAKDLATYTESAAGRMAIAWEKAKNAIADAMTPERIEKFVGALEGAIDKLTPLIEGAGKLADGLGKLYDAGKSIRGFLSADDTRGHAQTVEEIQRASQDNNISEIEAQAALQADYARSLELKRKIMEASPNDHPTEAADKLAVAASLEQTRPGITDYHQVAQSYINARGMSPQRYHELAKMVSEEQLASGEIFSQARRNRSVGEAAVPTMGEFKSLIETTLAPAISRAVIQGMYNGRPNVISIDGNPIAQASSNATDIRRR